MSTPRTVAFHTLGCKLNYSETSSIGQHFIKAGFQEVSFDQPSDFYVINTCSVTEQADKKCRKAVRAATKLNAHAKVIVMGCYAQLKPHEIASIPGVSVVLGAAEKFNILEHLPKTELHQINADIFSTPIDQVKKFIPGYSIEDRTRSFLKIQDGCDYKCSFCTIPLARGASRSGSVSEVFDLASTLVEKGIKEIVLTGVNIGDFGKSLDPEKTQKRAESFLDLIQKLDQIPSECRFRISSIEPNLCTKEIINFVKTSSRFMPHFHMPLQSGDDAILAKMQRRYKSELYRQRVEYIKMVMPHACIGVDVIAGFPGETDDHFKNTYDFLNSLDVSYLHVFTYSERVNTPAAQAAHSLPTLTRKERSDILRNLSDKKKRIFYEQNLGTVQKVLLENSQDSNFVEGYTPNYIRVAADSEFAIPNTISQLKLTNIRSDMLVEGVPV